MLKTARAQSIAVACIFILGVLVFSGQGRVFEYDTDEGIYLMRSAAYLRGAELYRDVWMDAPALFVTLLTGLFAFAGPSVEAARVLALCFGGALAGSFYYLVRRDNGAPAAAAAVFLLALSPAFLRLSVSAVPAIPLNAFGVLGCVCAARGEDTLRRRYLYLSAACIALGVLCKPFALLYAVPVCFLLSPRRVMCWWVFFLASFGLFYFATGSDLFQTLLLAKAARNSVISSGQNPVFWMKEEYDLVIAGALGLYGMTARRRAILPPLALCVISAAYLSRHAPLWYHHALPLYLSLCWLAAAAIRSLAGCRYVWCRISLIALVFLVAVRMPYRFERVTNWAQRIPVFSPKVFADLMQRAPRSKSIFTDRPMYAFRAGLEVPGYLITMSAKRLDAGLLTAENIAAALEKNPVDMVLLSRFAHLRQVLLPRLKNSYTLVSADEEHHTWLYVRNALPEPAHGQSAF